MNSWRKGSSPSKLAHLRLLRVQGRPRRTSRSGFTLMEVLLVLVILVVLGSMAVGVFSGTQRRALEDAARGELSVLGSAIELYQLHTKNYPKEIDELVTKPSGDQADRWEGPYVKKGLNDPWENKYRYSFPGKHNTESFDLWSVGVDGQDGTDDDVGNWES